MYNAMMKQKEVQIDRTSFFISPFPVFVAARITAMLSKTLAPVLGGVIALLGADDADSEEDTTASDVAAAIPAFSAALQSINPNDFEKLLRELLISSRNVAFKNDEYPNGEILTEDAVNALFAGSTQNMYVLAYYVIKENYLGFFEKLKGPSGSVKIQEILKKWSADTEHLTPANSETLSSAATL